MKAPGTKGIGETYSAKLRRSEQDIMRIARRHAMYNDGIHAAALALYRAIRTVGKSSGVDLDRNFVLPAPYRPRSQGCDKAK